MNMAPENDFLKGQIVGSCLVPNATTTSNKFTALYAEQRAIPFFIYSPSIFDGKATLRASFEIDWTWGMLLMVPGVTLDLPSLPTR